MGDIFRLCEDGFLRFRLLEEQDWIEHGFGTRRATIGPGWEVASMKQIHSATAIEVCGAPEAGTEGDALITKQPGVALAIRTADCVPVLLADPVRRVAAAVHSGWRGTVQEIVRATLERLGQAYKTNPNDILAAIGPGIGKCCFEVGPEVARQFAPWDSRLAGSEGKEHLDLPAIIVRQLTAAGVREGNIAQAGLCTMDRRDLFFSFRKEKEAAGRMVSWIGIRRPE